MLGTLNGGLEARGVKLQGDQIWADATGYLQPRDRLPLLTRVHVHYHLAIPPGTRETVDRLLEKHAEKCPTAQSFKGVIEVTWSADIVEGRVEG